ncbi:MAG: ribosome biogenesis GTPase Der [Gammaproteobacteria bacterium]|nr:ribosome biogenesis GTPase Der [Gammaproteobacteria bacterium]
MKPVVALVGRPNVGKSTLFNKLTRSMDALVADYSGLTRDRQYGDARVGDIPFLVIDTGGLNTDSDGIGARMMQQTSLAIDESDAVIFLVDGRAGLTPADQEIAEQLRRTSTPVLLVVNKIDGIGEEQARMEFFALGLGEPASIAAAHNRGIVSMVEALQPLLPESREVDAEATSDIRIAFVGRPNVGKSTLINRLVGAERVIAFDQPGTTRDSIMVPFSRAERDYVLIDTAGVRRRGKINEKVEKFSIVKTLQSIDSSNVCVMMIDASDSVTDQDLHLLGYIINKGRSLIVAVNKWDALDSTQRDDVKRDLERRVAFLKFTRIHFISALKGSGVGDLFKSINRAYKSAFTDLSTPKLTRMLEYAVEQHQPPLVNGRRIKLRFAHQGGVNPPIIVVHGKQTDRLPASYLRYLTNFFQQELHLFGTPLRIELRQGDNPFAKKSKQRK